VGILTVGFLYPFIIYTPFFRVHVNKGVLMHDMKVCKPKAAGRGICIECHAPKLLSTTYWTVPRQRKGKTYYVQLDLPTSPLPGLNCALGILTISPPPLIVFCCFAPPTFSMFNMSPPPPFVLLIGLHTLCYKTHINP
jgi:hypothetical protein